MTDREAFEAWFARRHNRRSQTLIMDFDAGKWEAWQAAIKAEREQSCKLADALDELLQDSQHLLHEDCEDGGYCPVRDGRKVLADFRDHILPPPPLDD